MELLVIVFLTIALTINIVLNLYLFRTKQPQQPSELRIVLPDRFEIDLKESDKLKIADNAISKEWEERLKKEREINSGRKKEEADKMTQEFFDLNSSAQKLVQDILNGNEDIS